MRLIQILWVGLFLLPLISAAQTITIADARALPVGSTVTVEGIITSGTEFGTIRYMQDGTGGIAIFSTAVASLQRGDLANITGVTMQYQNLLEISPVNTWSLNSSGNPLPTALNVTPSQLNESNESMLVRLTNVTFSSQGLFQGNTTYNYTANGETGTVYIRSSNPLVGYAIPGSPVTMTGLCSQYGNSYQVLPRDSNDLILSNTIAIITQPFPENISTTGFDVRWETDMPGNTFVMYGITPALELGVVTGPLNTTSPSVTLSGMNPSEVVYVRVFSVAGTDTASSSIKPYITKSLSSGDIKVYFNRPVSNGVANPVSNTAVQLPAAFSDTIKAYIDRSELTLDLAMYSFENSGTALISQAVNDAYNRGVRVRIITEGGNVNNGLQTLNPAIPILQSPTSSPFYYGIMHNKFFVIDAEHPNTMKPMVMTGSTNFSNAQLFNDRNNLVFIQDRSLARVYQMEFEEMWGGSGNQPDTLLSKFGPDKSDNTPKFLNIGGRKIEVLFSPSDNSNSEILRTISSAHQSLQFAVMVFTRTDLAFGVEDRVATYGVDAYGILNDSSVSGGPPFLIMQSVMYNNLILYDHAGQTGILHHKYLVVDQDLPSSDPLVLTGSHNWSTSANERNDENIIIIHDALIANQYYQEFHHLFTVNGGVIAIDEINTGIGSLSAYPNPTTGNFNLLFTSKNHGKTALMITDITGRMVLNQTVELVPGEQHVSVNTMSFSPGIYFVKMGEHSAKMVVVNHNGQ